MGMTMSEIGMQCLSTTLLGFGTVFAVLIIIMLIIYAMHGIFSIAENIKSRKQRKSIISEAAPEKVQNTEKIITDDSELIAVLTAAAAACMGKEKSDIIIRSYKRAGNKSSWNNQSIREQINNSL